MRWSLKFFLALRNYEPIINFQLEPKLGDGEQMLLYWWWFYEEEPRASGKKKWKMMWLRAKQSSRKLAFLKHNITRILSRKLSYLDNSNMTKEIMIIILLPGAACPGLESLMPAVGSGYWVSNFWRRIWNKYYRRLLFPFLSEEYLKNPP